MAHRSLIPAATAEFRTCRGRRPGPAAGFAGRDDLQALASGHPRGMAKLERYPTARHMHHSGAAPQPACHPEEPLATYVLYYSCGERPPRRLQAISDLNSQL